MTPTLIPADKLIDLTSCILERHEVPGPDARLVATSLVEADLRGVHSHGVLRLPRYVRELRERITNPRPHIRIAEQGPAYARVDGDGGLGQLVGRFAMHTAMDKARAAGAATVTAARSRHFGSAGFYALMAAEQDLIGLAMTVASPRLAPTGGTQPLFGNNPLALAVPGDQPFPLLVDFAAGRTGAGRLELAADSGQSIAPGLARDLEGAPTTDPAVGLKGSIVPIGEHKGYGLTLIIELLAGLLGGAPYFGVPRERIAEHMHERGIGHFFLVIDPARFMPLSAFKAAVAAMAARIKDSPRLPGVEEIFVPGEPEARLRRERLSRGIPLAPGTVDKLRRLGVDCGVEV